jgi:hypothetical protein
MPQETVMKNAIFHQELPEITKSITNNIKWLKELNDSPNNVGLNNDNYKNLMGPSVIWIYTDTVLVD